MLEIADLLRRTGDIVRFSSSGEVADYIEARGYSCNRLPLADVKYAGNGEMSLKATVAGSPAILARTYRQLYLELGNLKQFQPDVVLSDSSISTVFAARTLKVRVYAVLNQLSLSASATGGGVGTSLLSGGTSAGVVKIWEMSDAILISDLPPPFTISEANLWNSKVKNARYIGFLISSDSTQGDSLAASFASDRRPKIFWQVSGPPETRGPFIRAAEAIAAELSGAYALVLTEGDPTGSRTPVRIKGGWKYGWCDCSGAFFSSCDVVVARAGQGTIARAITHSKPSLLVPIPKQTEQEGNAAKAAKLGVSIPIRQGRLTIDSFRQAVEALRREPHLSRARSMEKIAARFDAKKAIVDLLRGNASRATEVGREFRT
jgi:UDP:flavonoid glycosyltransferase YjiC (YdhE family)